jgi:RNA polymerase primary sigma factor
MVRGQVDDVRKRERELRRIIVDKCGMPQERFMPISHPTCST